MAAPISSSITLDLSNISAQLNTNIGGSMEDIKSGLATLNQSIAKLNEQLSSTQGKTEEKLDISGMREQILANVEVLYPVLRLGTGGNSKNEILSEKPKFHLITVSSGTAIFACVIFSFPAIEVVIMTKAKLIVGPNASSTYQALEGLLDLTSTLLAERHLSYAMDPKGMGMEIIRRAEGQYFMNLAGGKMAYS